MPANRQPFDSTIGACSYPAHKLHSSEINIMGIAIDPTPAAPTWGGAIKPAIEAVASLISKSYVEAAFKTHETLKAARVITESVEQRAWTLWRESLVLTLGEFFKSAYLTRQPDGAGELARLVEAILTDSANLAREGKVELMAAHLKKPTDFPLYQALRKDLPEWARRWPPIIFEKPTCFAAG